MKYIKVSCDAEKSAVSMNWNTEKFLELGWEIAGTYLESIRMKQLNLITDDDVLIVSKDRSFLYENKFKTINYSDFKQLTKLNGTYKDITSNITQYMSKASEEGYYKDKYKYYTEDLKLINDINYDEQMLTIDEPFFVVHVRIRNWCEYRNVSVDYWQEIINKLLTKYQIKCYVFGEGSEVLTNVTNVNLKEYASLLHNENCKFMVGSMSGGSMIAQLCSRKHLPLFIIETEKQNNENPLFFSDALNFCQYDATFLDKDNLYEEIINKI